MSLYRYVARKEDLLDLALDAAFKGVDLRERPSGNWRSDLTRLAHSLRRAVQAHPWAPQLLATRPPLGPSYLALFEFALECAYALTENMAEQIRVVGLVFHHAMGAAYEAAERESDRRTGMTPEQMASAARPYLEPYLDSGRFPQLVRFLQTGPDPDREAAFQWGLDCLLDGLSATFGRAKT